MMGIVREVTARDRHALVAAIDAVCAENPWMLAPRFQLTPPWEHALRTPNCPRHLLLAAEDCGQVVGWCRLFPLAPCNGPAPELELGIGLLPAYCRQGLGRALVEKAAAWARKAGCQRIVLTTRVENTAAVGFFAHLGFTPTGQQRDRWIEMSCQLDHGGGGTNV